MIRGRSFDFGEPQWGVVNTLHVPQAYRSLSIVYEGDTPSQNFDVSARLPIDYYSD